jgi:hypothetical protein
MLVGSRVVLSSTELISSICCNELRGRARETLFRISGVPAEIGTRNIDKYKPKEKETEWM